MKPGGTSPASKHCQEGHVVTIMENRMTERIYNFSAGPAVLPVPVLEEAHRDMLSLPGVGMSVMEISHRSKTFDEIIGRAEHGLSELLGVPENYRVLFLQ